MTPEDSSAEVQVAVVNSTRIYPAVAGEETAFEKRRGIGNVEVRQGLAQAHVSRLEEPLIESRIHVLEEVGEAGISIDFLKFTQSGISFLISEAATSALSRTLENLNVTFSLKGDRHVVIVYAVNMRDEEGLIADVMQCAISSGAAIEHVTDMHDRMLMVVEATHSDRLVSSLLALQGTGGQLAD